MNSAQTGAAKHVPIIGIGASAGGLEAASQLLSHLSPELHHALVVLQHIAPDYKSMMAELLGRETRLQVVELHHNTSPEPGVVYVVPPNNNAFVEAGKLKLEAAANTVSPKPSIDRFFTSLANEQGEEAIGVVLSGTGSDGSVGLKAIQVGGGLTIAQAPNSAKYSGMPFAAISSNCANMILEPQDIANKLQALSSSGGDASLPVPKSTLEQLLQRLKEHSGVNFFGYKTGTLSRRIRRRMVATSCRAMEDYLELCTQRPEELKVLEKEILISVTDFFRDREAFAALRARVADILAAAKPNGELRLWVAGCATGEEAYTLAILVSEEKRSQGRDNPVQIFATDIDEDALNQARQGLYPKASLSGLSKTLLKHYFIKRNDKRYEVSKSLRDMLVFANHNLVSDPPFLRLDLVSCRNVLIYLDKPLQGEALRRFHFSLKPNGTLFLGRSESVGQSESLFSTVNRRERIFSKQDTAESQSAPSNGARLAPLPRHRSDPPQLILSGLTSQLNITLALCAEDGKVIKTAGDTSRFFRLPSSSSEILLSNIIIPQLKAQMLTQLHSLRKTRRPQQSQGLSIFGRRWRMSSSYIDEHNSNRILLSISELGPGEAQASVSAPTAGEDIKDELQVTREQLQSVIEQLTTANEEMQMLNEEAQASNEELQATNEEMEASNEELQATSQELVTLNEELSVKSSELSLLNQEYAHLYDSFDFPVMVFDHDQRLLRFNAPASMQFQLRVNLSNLHLSELRLPAYLDDLDGYLEQVETQGTRSEFLVEHDHTAYQLMISPGFDEGGKSTFTVVSLVDISKMREAERELNESKNRLKTIMDNTTMLISMKDLLGNYLYANEAFIDAFGLDPDNYEGKSDFELFPENCARSNWANDLEAIRNQQVVESETQFIRDGKVYIYRHVHQVLKDYKGKPNLIISEAEDITSRKQAEEKLTIAARVFQQAGEAIVVTDRNGRIQSINEAFSKLSGYSEQEANGEEIGKLLNSRRHSDDFFADMWHHLIERGHWQGEVWNRRKNGDVVSEWLTINSISNADNETECYISVFSDITSLKESQRKVEFLATHDALSGLPNRNLFMDRLDNALTRCRRNRSSLAVMFIDLDGFKTINDTLGHDIGDQLLIQVARKLQTLVRDIDTVSRLGGDEFTIALSECNPEEVQLIANRILDELSHPVEIEERKIFASASIGIALYPEDGSDSSGLLKAADTAMYKSKELGRNQYQFFHPNMRERLLKQSAMDNSIKKAIRLKQFRLVFQPKFSTAAPATMIGAEALLRWNQPELGEIPPAEFIPVAERNGSIIELSNLIIALLIEQLARLRSTGLVLPEIAFNVSARSFQQEAFVSSLSKTMQTYMLPPEQLKIEITEGAVMENNPTAIDNLEALRELGMGIAIDDFGTGYSSLSYLKQLPIDELKIDKSFVDGVGQDDNDEAISKAILSMAAALDLDVVAEGVETQAQLTWLQNNGCPMVQGYLLSPPLELEEFAERVLQQQMVSAKDDTNMGDTNTESTND